MKEGERSVGIINEITRPENLSRGRVSGSVLIPLHSLPLFHIPCRHIQRVISLQLSPVFHSIRVVWLMVVICPGRCFWVEGIRARVSPSPKCRQRYKRSVIEASYYIETPFREWTEYWVEGINEALRQGVRKLPVGYRTELTGISSDM